MTSSMILDAFRCTLDDMRRPAEGEIISKGTLQQQGITRLSRAVKVFGRQYEYFTSSARAAVALDERYGVTRHPDEMRKSEI